MWGEVWRKTRGGIAAAAGEIMVSFMNNVGVAGLTAGRALKELWK